MSAILKKLQKVVDDKNHAIKDLRIKSDTMQMKLQQANDAIMILQDETKSLAGFKEKYETTLDWGIRLENELDDLNKAIEDLE